MFRKKKIELKPRVVQEGCTPELIDSLLKRTSDRNSGFPSIDYSVVIDGFVIESNNFEIERRAYGKLKLSFSDVDVPVIIHFILPEDESYKYFQTKLESEDITSPSKQNKVYGKVILNAYGIKDGFPVLEWHLYLNQNEWDVFRQAFNTSGHTSPIRFGIRVGLPSNITSASIVDDSYNGRLLIYRVWFDSIKTYVLESLKNNCAFQDYFQGGGW